MTVATQTGTKFTPDRESERITIQSRIENSGLKWLVGALVGLVGIAVSFWLSSIHSQIQHIQENTKEIQEKSDIYIKDKPLIFKSLDNHDKEIYGFKEKLDSISERQIEIRIDQNSIKNKLDTLIKITKEKQ